jgi:hypothetical protein
MKWLQKTKQSWIWKQMVYEKPLFIVYMKDQNRRKVGDSEKGQNCMANAILSHIMHLVQKHISYICEIRSLY